jgi:hypothetical protein
VVSPLSGMGRLGPGGGDMLFMRLVMAVLVGFFATLHVWEHPSSVRIIVRAIAIGLLVAGLAFADEGGGD